MIVLSSAHIDLFCFNIFSKYFPLHNPQCFFIHQRGVVVRVLISYRLEALS